MLDFIKYNMILIYNKQNENIANEYVIIPGDPPQLSHLSLQWTYNRHPMYDYIEISRIDIYNWDKKIFPTFLFEFMFLYFYWVVYVTKGITANIQYQIIFTTRIYIYKVLTKNDFRQIC